MVRVTTDRQSDCTLGKEPLSCCRRQCIYYLFGCACSSRHPRSRRGILGRIHSDVIRLKPHLTQPPEGGARPRLLLPRRVIVAALDILFFVSCQELRVPSLRCFFASISPLSAPARLPLVRGLEASRVYTPLWQQPVALTTTPLSLLLDAVYRLAYT